MKNTMSPARLQEHMLGTYFNLRWGIVVAAGLLPLVLYFGGRFFGGLPLRPSISDYYFAGGGLMRDWFVGTLCAVGVFLYLYKGFSTLENVALNFAGIFAVLTALVPCVCGDPTRTMSIHGVSAVSFFIAMAVVCLFCATETLKYTTDEAFKTRYTRRYRIIGVALVASPVAAFAVGALPRFAGTRTFWIEAFAIEVFAAYWLVKSLELRHTRAEEKVLKQARP